MKNITEINKYENSKSRNKDDSKIQQKIIVENVMFKGKKLSTIVQAIVYAFLPVVPFILWLIKDSSLKVLFVGKGPVYDTFFVGLFLVAIFVLTYTGKRSSKAAGFAIAVFLSLYLLIVTNASSALGTDEPTLMSFLSIPLFVFVHELAVIVLSTPFASVLDRTILNNDDNDIIIKALPSYFLGVVIAYGVVLFLGFIIFSISFATS